METSETQSHELEARIESVKHARSVYEKKFIQNKIYDDPETQDPFYRWKSSENYFKPTLVENYISPLYVQSHEPVIGDRRGNRQFGLPCRLEWIENGKRIVVNLLEGSATESAFTLEPSTNPKRRDTVVERPRVLGDDEFNAIVTELRKNDAIERTGVLEDIESRRKSDDMRRTANDLAKLATQTRSTRNLRALLDAL